MWFLWSKTLKTLKIAFISIFRKGVLQKRLFLLPGMIFFLITFAAVALKIPIIPYMGICFVVFGHNSGLFWDSGDYHLSIGDEKS